jgi:hypothetical protein
MSVRDQRIPIPRRRRSLAAPAAALLGLSTVAAPGAAEAAFAPGRAELQARVSAARDAIRQGRSLTMEFENGLVAQWGNWPNWANWANWNNWNNWANWGNWFNR